MPIHEYRCPAGHKTEKFFRKMSDAEVRTPCAVCGAVAERQMSGAGLVFKGSGFYLTDYGKSGSAAAKAKNDSASESKSESGGSSSDGGGESKAAAGGETNRTAAESKPAAAAAPAASEAPKKKAPKSAPKKE
jgi:putative FmdB family regulatory protein